MIPYAIALARRLARRQLVEQTGRTHPIPEGGAKAGAGVEAGVGAGAGAVETKGVASLPFTPPIYPSPVLVTPQS